MTVAVVRNEMPPVIPLRIETVGKQHKHWITLTHSRRHVFEKDWTFMLPTGDSVYIPEGFETDGASFPWWLPAALSLLGAIIIPLFAPLLLTWLLALFDYESSLIVKTGMITTLVIWLIGVAALQRMILNPLGIALIPGVLHDYLYKHHYLLRPDGTKHMEKCTWWEADDLFKRVHVQVNDMWFIGWLTYKFLRLGSWFVWRRYRKS